MEWLSKLLGLKDKDKYECVFIKQGEWKIKNDNDSYDEYCEFQILHNRVTNEYKLKTFGYKPTSHTLYIQMFENYRGLQEGDLYYKGGKLYPHTNETIHQRPTK
jgi:hypothetical protein